ncbi:MAG: TolB family protein [Thermomicrobiales bacterium]
MRTDFVLRVCRPIFSPQRLVPVFILAVFLVACSGPGSDLSSPDPSLAATNTVPRPPTAPTVAPTARGSAFFPTAVATTVPTRTVPAPSPASTAPIPIAPSVTSVATPRPANPTIPPSTGPLQPAYRIAFVSNSAGSDDIWTVDPDGRRLTDLTKAQKAKGNDSDPEWSPDGKRIAFVSDRDGNADIWVMNADGTGARNLTHTPGDDLNPRWSPDGKRIAFTTFRDGDAEIYLMTADGAEQTNLTKADGDDLQPVWSPDGTQIAFISDRGKRPRALYALSLDAPKTPAKLAAPPCDLSSPVWSADGKTIAVVGCVGADGQGTPGPLQHVVYVVPAGGGALVAISDPKMESGGPAFAPDGKTIAYWSYRTPQQADIMLFTLGTNARRVIQSPPGVGREPAWSVDGAIIAFIGGDFTIGNLILVDGTGLTHNITNHTANDRSPRWSPQKLP